MSSVANRPVLVGVSPFTDHVRVLRWAAAEATRRGVGLRIAHAYPLLPPARIWPAGEPVVLADEGGLRRQARRVVALAARRVGLEHPDLPIDTVVAEGSVEEVLRRESEDAGLVVVGGDSRGPLAEAVLDSVAGTLQHDAACPVVALPPVAGAAEATGPVVVGVDEGGTSGGALTFGFGSASRAGVPLHAVHCWQAPRDRGTRVRERDDRLRMLEDVLAGVRGQYPDVAAVELLRDGHPLDELIAASRRAGLLVVGTRGRGPVTSAVLGSTSRALARCARCPVAVVHADYAAGISLVASSTVPSPGATAAAAGVPGGRDRRHRVRTR